MLRKKSELDLDAAIQLLPLKWYGLAVQNLAREFGTWDQFVEYVYAAREDLDRLRQRWPSLTMRDYIESVKYGMPDAPSPDETAKLYPAMSRLVEVYDVGFATVETLLTDCEVLEIASTMADCHDIKPHPTFGGILAGKEVCFTGTLQTMLRAEARDTVERLGGRVVSSVGPVTDFLVAGADASPQKIRKSEHMNIKILTELEFANMIRQYIK